VSATADECNAGMAALAAGAGTAPLATSVTPPRVSRLASCGAESCLSFWPCFSNEARSAAGRDQGCSEAILAFGAGSEAAAWVPVNSGAEI
jgi:hypothetical protein